jgi:hypothetical protein
MIMPSFYYHCIKRILRYFSYKEEVDSIARLITFLSFLEIYITFMLGLVVFLTEMTVIITHQKRRSGRKVLRAVPLQDAGVE